MRPGVFVLILGIVLQLAPSAHAFGGGRVSANTPTPTPTPTEAPERLLSVAGGEFSYISNHELNAADPAITRAIIVVHGSERNVRTYYNSMANLAKASATPDSTLVIAPHYKEPWDQRTSHEFTWSSEGWLSGDPANEGSKISSFDLIDQMVDLLVGSGLFPHLKNILITGHSAGGQLTQRYALGTSIDSKYPNIDFQFVVANPGTYAYPTAKRAVPGQSGRFEVPLRPGCDYNDYKYGLDHRNEYLGRTAIEREIEQYAFRRVTYLLGELDTDEGEVAQECEARWQGRSRLDRGKTFKSYMDSEFPTHHHSIQVVPGIGHTQWGMYNSPTGKKVLGF